MGVYITSQSKVVILSVKLYRRYDKFSYYIQNLKGNYRQFHTRSPPPLLSPPPFFSHNRTKSKTTRQFLPPAPPSPLVQAKKFEALKKHFSSFIKIPMVQRIFNQKNSGKLSPPPFFRKIPTNVKKCAISFPSPLFFFQPE